MGFDRNTEDYHIIAALDNLPNDIGGLSPAQLKAKFDEGIVSLQTFVNELIDALEETTDGVSSSERLGSGTITGVTGNTIHAQLLNLKAQVDAVILGTITDNSLTDAKLVATTGQIKSRVEALQRFPTAIGTATEIMVACPYFDLVDGAQFTFVARESNGGVATTIAANGKGFKPLYKPGTVLPPNILSGKAYTVWYDLAGDCLFLRASAEGTALPEAVLAGEPFSNETDVGLIGSMPNRAGDTVAAAISTVGTVIKLLATRGFRDGIDDNVTHDDPNRIPDNIRAGVTLDGVLGTSKAGASGATATIGYGPYPIYTGLKSISSFVATAGNNAVPGAVWNINGQGGRFGTSLNVTISGATIIVNTPGYNGNTIYWTACE